MNIYFPVFSGSVDEKQFSSGAQNPGVGGTQFTIIKLAILLAERFHDLNIYLINGREINFSSSTSNIQFQIHDNIDEFIGVYSCIKDDSIVVLTIAHLRSANIELLKKLENKIICWMHHPFQFDMSIRQVKPAAIVHVGSYQYFSNKLFYHSNWHIQNPFNIQSDNVLKELPSSGSPIRIIYLGALLRVKGFGHLVRHWKRLKLSIPNIELHVIGSSATYGKKPKHELIPCDRNFAEEVLSFIPVEDIKSGSVVFHGNLGEEKFELMRSAHLAILNPTGASEAFPASPLECMGCGLPVIASGDYGMSDSMRFFPELTLQNPDQIPSLVAWLLSDRYRYMELSARAIAVSGWFDSQTDVVLVRWRQLFDLVNSQVEGKILNNNPPIESFYGSMYKLRQRQLKALAGSAKRFFLESS